MPTNTRRNSRSQRDVDIRNALDAAQQLKRLREAFHYTQQEVERLTDGALVAQQVSNLESGKVERPSMRDLTLLGKLYGRTPNQMAELFGYWESSDEPPDDPRLILARKALDDLPQELVEQLLNNIEVTVILVQGQAKKQRRATP